MLHTMTYCSESTLKPKHLAQALEEIAHFANAANEQQEITGVLFYYQGIFLQTIEGKQSDLENLMVHLTKDTRHRNINILTNKPLTKRHFPQWHMAVFDISKEQFINDTHRAALKHIFNGDIPIHDPVLMRFYSVAL